MKGQLSIKKTLSADIQEGVCSYLANESGLSKSRIKDAMTKGALWLSTGRGTKKRFRKASANLPAGSTLELYYDELLLQKTPPPAKLLADFTRYSLWYKPSGLLSQGTMYGDHCALLRQAEQHFNLKRQVFLIHRLDLETSGLILIAHTKAAAAALSELFQSGKITKNYRAEITGRPAQDKGTIALPLDGKTAITEYEIMGYDPETDSSTVFITIRTGRLHQIRRHFEMIGHPVAGDPKYGKNNKNKDGLKLSATGLHFVCPLTRKPQNFNLESFPSAQL